MLAALLMKRSFGSALRAVVVVSVLTAGRVSGQASPGMVVPVPAPFLVTSGQGEAKVTPDRASLLMSVQTRAATAAAAGAENAELTRAVQVALMKVGLPRDQVTTEGYSVAPQMAYTPNAAPRVTGYLVSNVVRAETHQPAQVGAMVDAALAAGANVINSLSFYAASIETPRREAIALAVASARADAEAMARAAGGSLGGLLEMSTQGPTSPPRPMIEMSMMRSVAGGRADATPVTPGQQTVSVYVTARWAFLIR